MKKIKKTLSALKIFCAISLFNIPLSVFMSNGYYNGFTYASTLLFLLSAIVVLFLDLYVRESEDYYNKSGK